MKILVLNGHPHEKGFCNELVRSYITGCNTGNEVKEITTRDLTYPKDTKTVRKLILWADLLTFVYPIWWADMPSVIKIFWENVFEQGFAYRYEKSSILPKTVKLLKGKSVRTIITMDSPPFYYKYFLHNPAVKVMTANCDTCGMSFKGSTELGSIRMSSVQQREQWLKKIQKIGAKE